MNCNHEFIGTNKGVHCKQCGFSMTAEEYGKYINPVPVEAPAKKAPRKKVTKDE